VRYILPFKKEESCKLIEDLQIPKKFSVSADTVHDEITGGVPRQIVNLSQAEDLYQWRNNEIQTYFTLSEKTFSEMNTEKQNSFISFLNQLFEGRSNVRKPPSVWYDKGLFFFDNSERIVILNPLTQAALFSLWARHLKREIIDRPDRTQSETGAVFEREVIRGFSCLFKIEIEPFFIGPSKPQTKLLKISQIEQIIYFANENEIPHQPTIQCLLFKPISETYKAWDFFIEDGHTKQILFVQTSIRFPKSKKGKTMAKAFTDRDHNHHNQIERVLNSIFKIEGSKAHIENGSPIITLPIEGWTVKFLFVTSQHDADVKELLWDYDFLVAGRETLASLNLCFTQLPPPSHKHKKVTRKSKYM